MATTGNNPYRSYVETQVATATPEQLVIMLYNGAVQRCQTARRAMAERDWEATHHSLVKAQAIVAEMMASLDLEQGGELAGGLWRIYDYVYHQLVQANLLREVQRVEECQKLLQMLLDGWQEAFQGEEPETEAAAAREPQPAVASGGLNIRG